MRIGIARTCSLGVALLLLPSAALARTIRGQVVERASGAAIRGIANQSPLADSVSNADTDRAGESARSGDAAVPAPPSDGGSSVSGGTNVPVQRR